jgi:hypothetical protein
MRSLVSRQNLRGNNRAVTLNHTLMVEEVYPFLLLQACIRLSRWMGSTQREALSLRWPDRWSHLRGVSPHVVRASIQNLNHDT